MELIETIIGKLGIDESQAKGGVGQILGLAKEKLGGGKFAEIASAVPGLDALTGDAPKAEGGGLMGALGGVASALGADDLGDLAKLAGGFDKLGMDKGMIGKFVPVILDFVKDKGGDKVGALLEGVLK